MIKIATFIWWCWQNDYGDPLFWGIAVTFLGFLIHMMEDSKP